MILAHLSARQRERSHSLKKYRNKDGAFIEQEEDGFVQISIKREHLEELKSILTLKKSSSEISQGEITSLCGILADCGILDNKEN